uniref:The Thermotoga maritima cold shock protein mutant binding to AacEst n=1 Tax=Thermotoga maritima TaxID=2336 RepID=UPI00398D69C0
RGKVKWFHDYYGYGFITKDEGGDVFVNADAIDMEGFKTLKEGQVVEFEIDSTVANAPQAAHVKVVE